MEFSFRLNTDSEGYASQYCDACHGRFKVRFDADGPGPLKICPFCKHSSEEWWTPEQAEHIKSAALASGGIAELLHDFSRGLEESLNTPGSAVTWKAGASTEMREPLSSPDEPDEELRRVELGCCDRVLKHHDAQVPRWCPYCGEQIRNG